MRTLRLLHARRLHALQVVPPAVRALGLDPLRDLLDGGIQLGHGALTRSKGIPDRPCGATATLRSACRWRRPGPAAPPCVSAGPRSPPGSAARGAAPRSSATGARSRSAACPPPRIKPDCEDRARPWSPADLETTKRNGRRFPCPAALHHMGSEWR